MTFLMLYSAYFLAIYFSCFSTKYVFVCLRIAKEWHIKLLRFVFMTLLSGFLVFGE